MGGGDLGTLLAGGGKLEAGHALALVGQVAAALGPEHERGFAHGAIEPANVLIEGDRARLTGFGAARDPRAGAREYVAPEVAAGGEPTPRSDVYSLACLLCVALTGAPPEAGRLPSGLAEPTAAVLASALARDPAARPADAAELMRAVRAARRRGTSAVRRRRWWRRRRRRG